MNPSTKRKAEGPPSSEQAQRRKVKKDSLSITSLHASYLRHIKGLRSVPNEILSQILKYIRSLDAAAPNIRNPTRGVPAFITALKCDANHPARTQYLWALADLNRDFIHSLHFGNQWKFKNMATEELQSVQSVIVKFLNAHHHGNPERMALQERLDHAVSHKEGPDQVVQLWKQVRALDDSRALLPSTPALNSSLIDVPNATCINLEFKGSQSQDLRFRILTWMMHRLQAFVDDHPDFEIKTATLDFPTNDWPHEDGPSPSWKLGPQKLIKRITIPEVTKILGREVGFVLTDDLVWVLEDVKKQSISVKNTLNMRIPLIADEPLYPQVQNYLGENQGYANAAYRHSHRFMGSKWTWVFERKVQQ